MAVAQDRQPDSPEPTATRSAGEATRGEATRGEVIVAAVPEAVMAVIADLPAYPDWSPGIRGVEVLESHGGLPSRARFTVESGPLRDTYVLAYSWTERSVSWHLESATLLSAMTGSYDLDPVTGGTRVTYRLQVGLSVPMLPMMRRRAERTIVDTALRGLKERVEHRT